MLYTEHQHGMYANNVVFSNANMCMCNYLHFRENSRILKNRLDIRSLTLKIFMNFICSMPSSDLELQDYQLRKIFCTFSNLNPNLATWSQRLTTSCLMFKASEAILNTASH